jgi:hypothetical protein
MGADIFGRARGNGTRAVDSSGTGRASPLIAGRNSGRSLSCIWDNSGENAGVAAMPANTSVAKIVLTLQLITLSPTLPKPNF